MNDDTTHMVKVRFRLGDVVAGETMWAKRLEGNRFLLMNIPFLAYGYAEGDIVVCVERDGWDEVAKIVEDSGNGTLRIRFLDGFASEAQRVLDELASVGCEYERIGNTTVAVTVPPTLAVPFSQLSDYLNTVQAVKGWEIGKKVAPREK
jgi:hypothetical protein